MVGAIRGLIDARNLGVGDPLPSERELCEMFSSSRNTVREAMRMLKTYGVVEVRPKIGAILIDRRMDAVFDLYSFNTLELTRETFLDTQGFRQLIEVGSIDTLFARATPEDVAELRSINDQMQVAETIERSAVQDFHFHARLIAILRNRQIFQFPAKTGPFRVALANGYIANTWRIQMIQTAKAYAAQPEVAAKLKPSSRSSRPARTSRRRSPRSTTSSIPAMTRSSSTRRTRRPSLR
jgi:DNA-binding GntR family transcriptional regulator